MFDIHGQTQYLSVIKRGGGRGQVWGVVGLMDSNFVKVLSCFGAMVVEMD